MKYYHVIKELLRDLRFFLKSFYFFFNRIARYAQSKESRNLSSEIPQTTYKAIFRSCLMSLAFISFGSKYLFHFWHTVALYYNNAVFGGSAYSTFGFQLFG